jgi:hypothetical protein
MNLTEVIKTRVPEETYNALQAKAEKEDLPVSIIVRRAIRLFLEQNVHHCGSDGSQGQNKKSNNKKTTK